MRKDFKYAQRLQAAFGRPKYPGAASGRLKVTFSQRKMCQISQEKSAVPRPDSFTPYYPLINAMVAKKKLHIE